MIHLQGMAFDHPRGFAPMRATSEKFQVSNPDLRISWDARSLKDFEDYPIEKLAEKYDLIMMDHPFIGSGVKAKRSSHSTNMYPRNTLRTKQGTASGPATKATPGRNTSGRWP